MKLFLGKSESSKLLDLTTGYSRGAAKVFLTSDDLKKTHLHGIGAPGSGKSKMIENIARQLVDEGEGFCLIDPHGTLYDAMVTWLSYRRPQREVILFNPSVNDRILGFNPFRAYGGDLSVYVDRLTQLIVRVRLERSTDERPRLERLLKNVLYALLEQQLPFDAARYLLSFEQKAVREYITERIKSPDVRDEFDGLNRLNVKDFRTEVESVRNRLGRFLQSEQVRRIVNLNHHIIDFHDIIEGKKILLCNLHDIQDTLSLESASLLGTLIFNELWMTAKQRKGEGGRNPHDFYVIIDEFQNFITPDIPEILPQSRKFGLKFMLFHQYLDQLKEKDERAYKSVMNTCQLKLVFGGLTDEDARVMVREIFPGQINLKRIKFLNQQVQFWPRVGRAESRTESDSEGHTHASGSSGTSGAGRTSAQSWGPELDQWVTSDSDTSSSTDGWTSSDSDTSSHSVSVTDLPFIYPERHVVDGPPVTYTEEEVISELAGLMRNQFERHYFIRQPGQPTVAAVTPYVDECDMGPDWVTKYVDDRQKDFLNPNDVDIELKTFHQQLALRAGKPDQEDFDPDDIWEKPS